MSIAPQLASADPPSPRARLSVDAWRTITILSLVTGYAGYYLCRSDLSVAAPLLTHDPGLTGITNEAVGAVASAGILLYSIGKTFSGVFCDFAGGRLPFLAAMLAAVACTAWFGAGAGLTVFFVAWGLNRLVQSTGWNALIKISSNWFSFDHYGRVMGILSLSWLFGDAVGRLFLGWLIHQGLGWRGVFFTAAGVLFLIWAVSLVTVKETPEDIGGDAPIVNPDNLFGEEGSVRRAHGLRELLAPYLGSISFWAVMIMCFAMTLIRETFNFWTPTWLKGVAGIDAGHAAMYSSLYPFFGGCSVLVCGWISDRLLGGRRGPVITLPLLLLVPTLVVMGRLHAGAGVVAPLFLVSLAAFLMIGPYAFLGGAIALDLGGRHGSATAAGLVDCAGYLGGMLSGWAVGSIADRAGWPVAFAVLGGVAVIALLAAAFYWVRHEVWEHRVGG